MSIFPTDLKKKSWYIEMKIRLLNLAVAQCKRFPGTMSWPGEMKRFRAIALLIILVSCNYWPVINEVIDVRG